MSPKRREVLALSGALLAGSSFSGCTQLLSMNTEPQLLASELQRDETPNVTKAALGSLVQGNTDFAFDLLDELIGESPTDNLLISPYSISVALAMTWAGARGTTEQQMADALRYPLGQKQLHPAFNALDQALEQHEKTGAGNESEGQPFQLDVVNSIWGQKEYPFRETYLDILALNYGAGIRLLDFKTAPDRARTKINEWVGAQTDGKIEELLPKGVITDLTRLVLVNAIYFKANWEHTFQKEETEDGEFTALDGTTSTVPMMRQTESFPYAEADGHQLIELPYVGGEVGMVVILPAEGEFEMFERSLDAERFTTMVDALDSTEGEIVLPRFAYDSKLVLKDALSSLGMPVAFDLYNANFSGMADLERTGKNLFIDDAIQKSYIAVDEEGTEATAATAVTMGAASAPPPPGSPFEMVVDRPFLTLIRERKTGTILFVGRVVDAGKAQ